MVVFSLVANPITSAEVQQQLSLERAISLAQNNDPWLSSNKHTEQALYSKSVSASALPDPKVSIGLANLPLDSFDFAQEAMTQFKVGVSQQFARGDSLELKERHYQELGLQQPLLRENRKALVAVKVSRLWFDLYHSQASTRLIKKNLHLFEQLVDITESKYASAMSNVQQQDLIRPLLELTRLKDRLTLLQHEDNIHIAKLNQLLSNRYQIQSTSNTNDSYRNYSFVLSNELVELSLDHPELFQNETLTNWNELSQLFMTHPLIKAMDHKIKAQKTNIAIAEQQYKPQWAVSASYGYRDDGINNINRDDFFSIGITFDLPIFTDKKQDKDVQSEVSKTSALKTDKWLLLRELITSFEAKKVRYMQVLERQRLYRDLLVPQVHQQAKAALAAYTSDQGDFAEVVRAHISVINTEMEALNIDVEKQQLIAELNYYFTSGTNSTSSSLSNQEKN